MCCSDPRRISLACMNDFPMGFDQVSAGCNARAYTPPAPCAGDGARQVAPRASSRACLSNSIKRAALLRKLTQNALCISQRAEVGLIDVVKQDRIRDNSIPRESRVVDSTRQPLQVVEVI